jgi:hypothetical protein
MDSSERKTVKFNKPSREKEKEEEKEDEPVPKRPERQRVVVNEKTEGGWNSVIFVVCCMLVCCFFTFCLTIYYHKPILVLLGKVEDPEWELHRTAGGVNTTSIHALFDTTSREEIWQVRRELLLHLAREPGVPMMCMHHLRHPVNMTRVRICIIHNRENRQYLFMQNPRLIGFAKGQSLVNVRQSSIACSPIYIDKKRSPAVYMEWEDELSKTQYMMAKGELAFTVQLYLEEFVGDKHCQ